MWAPPNVAKENWLVSRPAIFCPVFSSGSTALFWIYTKEPLYSYTLLKKWFLYILLWPHSQSYNTWLIYLHLGQVIFQIFHTITTEFVFSFFCFFSMSMDSAILVLSISGIITDWYYHQLFLLHYHCLSIIITVYLLQGLRETVVFLLALNISNIELSFMEIIQLTCVTSWLAGYCTVYTGT